MQVYHYSPEWSYSVMFFCCHEFRKKIYVGDFYWTYKKIQKQIFHLAFLYMKRYLYHGKKIAVFKLLWKRICITALLITYNWNFYAGIILPVYYQYIFLKICTPHGTRACISGESCEILALTPRLWWGTREHFRPMMLTNMYYINLLNRAANLLKD